MQSHSEQEVNQRTELFPKMISSEILSVCGTGQMHQSRAYEVQKLVKRMGES